METNRTRAEWNCYVVHTHTHTQHIQGERGREKLERGLEFSKYQCPGGREEEGRQKGE